MKHSGSFDLITFIIANIPSDISTGVLSTLFDPTLRMQTYKKLKMYKYKNTYDFMINCPLKKYALSKNGQI